MHPAERGEIDTKNHPQRNPQEFSLRSRLTNQKSPILAYLDYQFLPRSPLYRNQLTSY